MKKMLFGLIVMVILCVTGSCLAVDNFTVHQKQYDAEAKTISMIINDNRSSGQVPNAAEGSIEGMDLTKVEVSSIDKTDVPVTFVFVVDNTTTAYVDQKKRPSEIGAAISNARSGKDDEYYLISYDTEVHSPVGPAKYPDEVLETLTYNVNSDKADYSGALESAVDLLQGIAEKDAMRKMAIILVTDGYQTDSPAIQHRALLDMLVNSGVPVYTCALLRSQLGQYVKDDIAALSEISSQSGGLGFSYQNFKEENNPEPGKSIINHIHRSSVLTAVLPDDYTRAEAGSADISLRLLRNKLEIGTLTVKADLPAVSAGSGAGESKPEAIAPETEQTECDPNDASCGEETSKKGGLTDWFKDHLGENWMMILCAGILFVILIVLVIVFALKKKSDKGFEVIDETDNTDKESSVMSVNIRNLALGNTISADIPEGGFQKFGRHDDLTEGVIGLHRGEKYIARKQFMLSIANGEVFVEDLGSENGTYLNGERVRGKLPIPNGSQIRIGNISGEREFRVSFQKK